MPTCRVIIKDALRALRALAPGDDPDVDELAVALEGFQNLVLDFHERRGPLLDVDISAATYIPGQDQRIRIQSGDTAAITLPNAVPMRGGYDPYDYGFNVAQQAATYAPQGTTGAADNVSWRQPDDMARIEIVGVTQALYFYRADLNQWMPALGLVLDTESPFNARYAGPLGALLADRLLDSIGGGQITPTLARRILRANVAMLHRVGARRTETQIQSF